MEQSWKFPKHMFIYTHAWRAKFCTRKHFLDGKMACFRETEASWIFQHLRYSMHMYALQISVAYMQSTINYYWIIKTNYREWFRIIIIMT